jgi:hypothetical protein
LARGSASSKGDVKTVNLRANLNQLNGSGVSGTATAVVRNQMIRHIEVHATGLTPDAPHAQHIHYGNDALNECPTLALDTNGDGRLNTVEGVPAYGPVVVSLNTTGDTTPASFLTVSRFPVSVDGSSTTAATTSSSPTWREPATPAPADWHGHADRRLRPRGRGRPGDSRTRLRRQRLLQPQPGRASELDANLPAEATDPAACGVLRVVN